MVRVDREVLMSKLDLMFSYEGTRWLEKLRKKIQKCYLTKVYDEVGEGAPAYRVTYIEKIADGFLVESRKEYSQTEYERVFKKGLIKENEIVVPRRY